MMLRIQNDEELAEYTAELFKLTAKGETTSEEDEAIDRLTLLIEHYEAERYPFPQCLAQDVRER
jgi:HTH-type transcriptional regulator/antitoxin HigA